MTAIRRPPTATLFAQLLGLVVLSLVGAITINLLIILNLAPPMPDFYRMSEIARVLKAGPGATTNDRRPLIVHLDKTPPGRGQGDIPGGGGPNLKRDLAQMIGVNPAQVQ